MSMESAFATRAIIALHLQEGQALRHPRLRRSLPARALGCYPSEDED